MKHKLALLALLGLILVLPIVINATMAQAQNNSVVTITPTTKASAPYYQSVGINCTLSFDAVWSSGDSNGNPIQNATATIEVKNQEGKVVENLKLNTGRGTFTFNYTTSTVDILTFTPTSLTTQVGETYTVGAGLQSSPVVVLFDTFKVELLSCDTSTLGKTVTTVKVTYLLLNDTDLSYDNLVISKKLTEMTVTINGVQATETQPSIFTAEGSLINPTAYINVQVSQEGWTKTVNAFSQAHTANERVWVYAAGAISAFALAAVGLHFVLARKASHDNPSLKPSNWSFIGALLLAGSSVVSLFWALTGLEGCMHLFDWILLSVFALTSFVLGMVGAVLAFRRRFQALAIFATILPLLTNVVVLKAAFDSYMLSYSLITLVAPAILSIASTIAISSPDDAFEKPTKQ